MLNLNLSISSFYYLIKTLYKKNFRKFNALKEIDEKMLQYINFENGYYIEMGAHDGVHNSNTFYFEKYKKWKGILIEPSEYFEFLIKNRSNKNKFFNCGCSKFNEKTETILVGAGDFSVCVDLIEKKYADNLIKKQIKSKFNIKKKVINLRNLNSILDESKAPKLIDFFSLDVEGMEINVLQGIDFKKYNFNYLLVECSNEIKREQVFNFLKEKQYKYVENITPWDVLFKYQT